MVDDAHILSDATKTDIDQKLAGLERKVAEARAELLAAARARKVLDKLREKQKARWQAELDRKESAALDEIGAQGAVRRLLELNDLGAA